MPVDASRLNAAIERWSVAVMYVARDRTVAHAREDGRVPIGPPRSTGGPKLRESIRGDPQVQVSGTRRTARVFAPVIQAATTDKGARAHVIRPKRAGGLLVFYWPKAGQTVFLPRVNHPGNAPHPWWEAVVRDAYAQALVEAARQVPFGF